MHLPRLRPAPVLDRCAPHHLLVRRRLDLLDQPGVVVPSPPRSDPPRRLASLHPRRAALVHPTPERRPRPNRPPTRPPPNTQPLRRGTSTNSDASAAVRRGRG